MMPESHLKLHISLHDITPHHLKRLWLFSSWARELSLPKITLLFVPKFHGYSAGSDSEEFLSWISKLEIETEWFLHGYYHLEDTRSSQRVSDLKDFLKRKFLTEGEGEFLKLEPPELGERLDKGIAEFETVFHQKPEGFVAPAWLFNTHLEPALASRGIRFTESHRELVDLSSGKRIISPVITWATRTPLRKYGSLVVCPTLARIWKNETHLRVAIHPHDFDHPETVKSLTSVISKLLKNRQLCLLKELKF